MLSAKSRCPSVVIIGNCQAHPMSLMLQLYFSIHVSGVYMVHRPGAMNPDELNDVCEKADYILAQPVKDTYKTKEFHTSRLMRDYPGKVIQWVNCFFTGYNPELRYLPLAGQRLPGALGDYHISDIAKGYLDGTDARTVELSLLDVDYNEESYKDSWDATLNEFEIREKEFDTGAPVAKFIRNAASQVQLFYTFNHPTNRLLFHVAKQIARVIGVEAEFDFNNRVLIERLSDIQLPVNPFIKKTRINNGSTISYYVGYQTDGAGMRVLSAKDSRVIYTHAKLVESFYRLYDANHTLIKTLSGKM